MNKHVKPRVGGITSRHLGGDAWEVSVGRSERAPHLMEHEVSYEDQRGRRHSAFYPGQVYVRHSSKTEPATADDLQRLIQRIVGSWIGKIGRSIENLSVDFSSEKSSLPVRLTDDTVALTIGITDPNAEFPYTARTLGQLLGKTQNWTHKAADRLGLKDRPGYSLRINGSNGQLAIRRYNKMALEVLQRKLNEDPAFDPYRSDLAA